MSFRIHDERASSDYGSFCFHRSQIRFAILACLLASTSSLLGCQGLWRRGRDDLAVTGEMDDDWSYPSRAKSQVPRPVASATKLNQGRAQDSKSSTAKTAAMTPMPSSAKLRESTRPSPGPVAFGSKETKDSTKTSDPSSTPTVNSASNMASTAAQDIDIEGALGSLPPEYRDVLKKQLEVVQTKLAMEGNSTKPSETLASTSSTSGSKSGVSIRLSDTASKDPRPISNTALAESSPSSSIPTTPTASPTAPASPPTPTTATSIASSPITGAGVVTASGQLNANSATNSSVVTASVNAPAPTLPPLPSSNSPPNPSSTTTWKQEVNQAIELLEKQIKETPSSDESMRLSQEVTLRLLYVSQRRLADACRPIDLESLSDSEQDYLRNQMIALHEASNPDAMPVRSRHWSLVMNSQREATNHLAAASNLEVKSLAFCTEVERYGVITKFPKNLFQADQEVLLYCEIENVAAEKVRNGFESQLQGSYEIIDSQGRKVADQLLPMEPELCQNHRRDYFIVYKIYMPQQIVSGNYQLRLTIEDLKARKFGQGQVDFQIKR